MTNRLLAGISAAALLLSACDADQITDANNNPNDPTNAPSSALFTNASRLAATRWIDGVNGTRYGFLPQHLAQVQYPDDDSYLAARLGAAATTGLFDGSYNAELQDLSLVSDRGVAAANGGLSGPADVLMSWEFGVLTDVFGDVPYSDAFDAAILQPSYQSQTTIYDGIFSTLAAASTALGTGTNVLGVGDPIYAGDPASWRRFANSLRLRHAMRLMNVDAARAGTQVAAALADAGGLIDANSENASMAWPGDGIYDSPWAANFKGRDDHRISIRLLTILRDLNDPRLPIYAMPPSTDPGVSKTDTTLRYCPPPGTTCYVGLMNALTQAVTAPLVPVTSRPGAIFYPGVTAYGTFGGTGQTFPSTFMSAAETEFLLAEAAERGVGGATAAATHYANGITLSMEQWGITGAPVTTYLAQATVDYAAAGTQQERLIRIATQKWLALLKDPIQAWMEVRRTCQPAIVAPGPSARFDTIPRRFQYSTTEGATNAASRSAAVAAQWPTGGDVMTNRVYWDAIGGWNTSPTYQAGCSESP